MHIHNIICVRPLKLRLKSTLCVMFGPYTNFHLLHWHTFYDIFSFSNEYIYSSTLIKTPVHHLLSNQPIMWHRILQL